MIITLNRDELIRRKQALIRQGQKQAFTQAVKAFSPLHSSKPIERILRVQARVNRTDVHILLSHQTFIKRRQLGLRPDYLVRPLATIEKPKKSKRVIQRRAPEGLTEIEKKTFRRLKWYIPGMFLKWNG